MKRRWLRSIAAALGVTTICCLWIVGPLVSPSHDAIYHWSGPAHTIFIPSILDFICVWFIFAVLLFASQGARKRSVRIWAGIMLFLPWAALKSLFLLMGWYLAHWISIGLFGLCVASFVLFNVVFKRIHRTSLERLQRITTKLLCLMAVCGACILVQFAWFGWQARRLNVPQPLHQTTKFPLEKRVEHPRIIWILLDELSYQQVYGHRFHTLSLPAFDQLAKQSTVFTHAVPAGIMTEIVMPSLIAGTPVDQIQPLSTGNGLTLRNPLTKRWQIFDPHDTVFHDALNAGYTTAIAGWYNPYCRILPEVLDQCFWTFDELAPNKMLPQASFARNILNPLLLSVMNRLPSAITHGNKAEDFVAKTHISDYRQISDAADRLLQNPSFDFILIHMAVPHPGGIYNRATHSFTIRNSSYIDNLALADSYLAHVRSLLESTGQWDSSSVVIMGDHSWRTQLLWASKPDWTPEEQQASNGGQFDDRPAYIVKLPEQKDGTTINTPFAAVNTRMLFNAIMKKRIVSTEDLSSWIEMLNRKQLAKMNPRGASTINVSSSPSPPVAASFTSHGATPTSP
jgi:hypothetical protein